MSTEGEGDQGIVDTWIAATFAPRRFFLLPARTRSSVGPVAFAMIVAAATGFASAVVAAVIGDLPATKVIGAAIVGTLFAPVGALFSLYVSAGMLQFWLMVARVKPRPFSETLACVGYSTAPSILGVIPVVGPVIGGVWQLVVLWIGLRTAHRTGRGQAAFAVLSGPSGAVLLALLLRAGAVEAFKIPSGSMTPSLVIGDHVFVDKLTYGPLIPWTEARLFSRLPPPRGDVMVFKFPENKAQDFVKRVIANPGDTLEVINGRPILDGWLVPHCHVGTFRIEGRTSELYVEFLGDHSYLTLFDNKPDEETCADPESCGPGLACRAGLCGTLQGPFKVAPGETWVLGDNRNNSHDSRSWRGGMGAGVPFENIKGRVRMVWMSFGPGGGIAEDRIFLDVNGPPVIPAGQDPTLKARLAVCMRERPERAKTTPPARGAGRQ